MISHTLTFDAISEAQPGTKWTERWRRSWPAYEAWFLAGGGETGPTRAECEAALATHMPELLPVHARLTALAGGSDRAARFLSTWNPPRYLGGCSIAAKADMRDVRLVRNYDLSPDLNEGLLLRTEWTGMPVMGMIEFLWGLSDGINGAGLSVALAFGGTRQVASGFGITTILRYVLETCATVAQALVVLRRVPSHMAYNIVLADRSGKTALAQMRPGGGATISASAIATNHQTVGSPPERPEFTRTVERRKRIEALFKYDIRPKDIGAEFMKPPLRQERFAEGMGTLFTAEYEPMSAAMTLRWPDQIWEQSLDEFDEGRREIVYTPALAATPDAARHPVPPQRWNEVAHAMSAIRPYLSPKSATLFDTWTQEARDSGANWARFGEIFAA